MTRRARLVIAALILAPGAMIAYKLSGLPGSSDLSRGFSFESLAPDVRTRSLHLLVAPLGALIVVFFRLTIGIRVLGPFRSVLLAIAFQLTGAGVGLAFFALVVGAVVGLRTFIKELRLPYFGRASAKLVAVAAIVVLTVLAGLALGLTSVERVSYFPIVVLTLTGDAFATALRREGARSAIWRAGATAGVALLITLIASVPGVGGTLIRFPELVLVCLAGVVLVARFASFRWLQGLNPPVRRRKKKRRPDLARSPASTVEPLIDRPV